VFAFTPSSQVTHARKLQPQTTDFFRPLSARPNSFRAETRNTFAAAQTEISRLADFSHACIFSSKVVYIRPSAALVPIHCFLLISHKCKRCDAAAAGGWKLPRNRKFALLLLLHFSMEAKFADSLLCIRGSKNAI
jgi:hypothetical protein